MAELGAKSYLVLVGMRVRKFEVGSVWSLDMLVVTSSSEVVE